MFLLSGLLHSLCGQNKYWVSFKDKSGVSFDPATYFSPRTLAQRQEHNIPLIDSMDFPVNKTYLKQVSRLADSLSWASRWLNGVAVYASSGEIDRIRTLSCVLAIENMGAPGRSASVGNSETIHRKEKQDALLNYQIDRLQGKRFSEKGWDGQGILIAVFDAGFSGADKHPAFERLRKDKRLIDTYDFILKKKNVFGHHWHGTATLSCIAGKTDHITVGMAYGAEILLARTEHAFGECFSEEENWLAAVEWADRLGANIISSSLGFSRERYFNTELDGHQSLVARAATIAAQKGILVINAAGNDGNTSWKFVDTPGDADSVLTVGGTDPDHDAHFAFSSFGPTSDGRMKPNVSAPGKAVVARGHGYGIAYGTSFSTPLVAGFAACAWQSHRSWTNMELFKEIEKSSHLYPYFDYAHGYGIPQAVYFISNDTVKEPTFNFVIINDDIKVILQERYSYPFTEKLLGFEAERNLFYKIESENGVIRRYLVISDPQKEALHFHVSDFLPGDQITVHFEGYTSSFAILADPEQNIIK